MAFTITNQPKQFLPESEKTKIWYKENLQFIMSHFNKRNDRISRIRQTRDYENPIDEIVRMYTYYLGRQWNKDYYYTTQDQNSCDLPTVWINGQKVTSLVDFMVGNAIKMIENIEPSVKAQSKTAINKRTKLLERALLMFDAPDIFNTLAEFGFEYQPLGNATEQMEIPEDVHRYMEYDYRQYTEVLAMRMCEDILHRNDYKNKLKQAFLYTLLGGRVGLENRIENGKQYFDVILPHNLILDTSKDDDFNQEARFVGKVDWLNTTDVIERYQEWLTDEEKKEIKEITMNNLYQLLDLTTHPYATNWAFNYNNLPTLACVTGYWIGMKDLGYEESKDKFGNTHISKIRNGRKSKFWTKTVYKGTLIGNKYVVEWEEVTNQVRKHDNPGDVELPLKVFIPNMVMGENRSIVARLHQHQDRIDYITNEITKMLNRAKGKVYLINKQKLGTSTAKDVISDFELMGIHITDGSATGEEFVAGQDARLVEVVDMTLDPNVQQLVNLRREEERLMEEIVNIPKVALGQQTGYVGAKTQAGTIAQSNLGTSYLYQGFIEFFQKELAFALNQYKVSLMSESEQEIPVIGTRGKEWLKITKEFQMEELGVYIKVKDFMDDQARERLIGLAQAAMQNGLIDMTDYIKIEQARSYTELLGDLKYSMNKKKRDAEKQQAMQQMMQQAMMEQQMAQQQGIAQMKEDGSNYRAELGAQSKMAQEAFKAGVSGEATPEEGLVAEQEAQDQDLIGAMAQQQMMGQ
jgi:hypothetical protein